MSDKELTDLEVATKIVELRQGPASETAKALASCLGHTSNLIGAYMMLSLRDEFEVEVDYGAKLVGIFSTKTIIHFKDKSGIDKAVCKCILESKK